MIDNLSIKRIERSMNPQSIHLSKMATRISKKNAYTALVVFLGSSVFVFLIAAMIVVALLPLYLNNRSVPIPTNSKIVYTLTNLVLSQNSRSIRDVTDQQSNTPTTAMISSIANQFNALFSSLGAQLVITQSVLSSTGDSVTLTMKIFFDNDCPTCHSKRMRAIQQALSAGQSVQVDFEYRVNCSPNPVNRGTRKMGITSTSGNGLPIPQIDREAISSLVQQADVCAQQLNSTTTTATTPMIIADTCVSSASSGTLLTLNPTDNQTYAYYCFSFCPSASTSAMTVQFAFSSNNPNLYIELDDVTLNSTTTNLIVNGGFETSNYTAQWTVVSCGASCDPGVDDLDPHSGCFSFYSSGVGVTLSQTVSIDPMGQNATYQLGFWIAYECGGMNSCSIQVSLTTASAS